MYNSMIKGDLRTNWLYFCCNVHYLKQTLASEMLRIELHAVTKRTFLQEGIIIRKGKR